MAKPRIPRAKAAVTGRDVHDPGRFEDRNEPQSNGPLGDPPAWIQDTDTNKSRAAWELFRREIPWLNESHRMLVGMASKIQGRLMAGEDVGVQAINLLRQMLGQMGATPADSSKVAIPDGEKDKDAIAELLGD